jgi:hypothetical protein
MIIAIPEIYISLYSERPFGMLEHALCMFGMIGIPVTSALDGKSMLTIVQYWLKMTVLQRSDFDVSQPAE